MPTLWLAVLPGLRPTCPARHVRAHSAHCWRAAHPAPFQLHPLLPGMPRPNPAGIIWMWVSGYGMACSTRVSNSLGAGCPRVARRATWVAVAIALALVRARWGVRAAREDNCPAACCL